MAKSQQVPPHIADFYRGLFSTTSRRTTIDSREWCGSVSRYFSDAHFSLEAIYQAKAKATTAIADPYRQIVEHMRSQAVAFADETSHFRGTECRWFWKLVINPATTELLRVAVNSTSHT